MGGEPPLQRRMGAEHSALSDTENWFLAPIVSKNWGEALSEIENG